MDVIDAVVLDYGFQSIVNRSAKHPVDWALSTAIGGSVMLSVGLSTYVSARDPMLAGMGLLAIFIQGFAVGVLNQGLQQIRALIVPGTRNPLRYWLQNLRLMCAAMVVWFVGVLLLLTGIGALITMLCSLGAALWCATFYFESCDCPPFKPKRVQRKAAVRLADVLKPTAGHRARLY